MSVPEGWSLRSIGSTGEVVGGRQRSPHLTDGKLVPYLRVANVLDGWIDYADVNSMHFTEKEMDKYRLVQNDILLNEGQSLNLVGRAAMFAEDGQDYAFQNTLIRYRAGENVDQNFAIHLFRFCQVEGLFSKIAVKTNSIAHLGISRFSEMKLLIPPLPEQRKIAKILRTSDDAIELTERNVSEVGSKHDALVAHLVGGLGHEHNVGLDSIVESVTAKNSVGNTNVLTSSARLGLVSQGEYFNKNVAGANLAGYLLLEKGDFAYNRSASKGNPFGVVRRLEKYSQGILSTLYLCFRITDEERINSDYLAHLLESGMLNRQLSLICQAGARSHGLLNVSKGDFFQLVIPAPRLEAQIKIARALDTARLEKALLSKKLEALKEQKRGLMQQLLTGKIRVKVDEGEVASV